MQLAAQLEAEDKRSYENSVAALPSMVCRTFGVRMCVLTDLYRFWMTGKFHFLTSAGFVCCCSYHRLVRDNLGSNLVPDPVAGAVVEGCTNSWSEVGVFFFRVECSTECFTGRKTHFYGQVCSVPEKF